MLLDASAASWGPFSIIRTPYTNLHSQQIHSVGCFRATGVAQEEEMEEVLYMSMKHVQRQSSLNQDKLHSGNEEKSLVPTYHVFFILPQDTDLCALQSERAFSSDGHFHFLEVACTQAQSLQSCPALRPHGL